MVETHEGYPEEGELVIATVSKIQYHSIFCNLDEYPGRSGMMHISEVAPGRIKNITDYVKEGKTVILKVLRIDMGKGHIDLSLRRVSEAQRRAKSSALKQQQIVERIAEQAGEQLAVDKKDVLDSLSKHVKPYPTIYDMLQAVIEDGLSLKEQGLNAKQAEIITSIVEERIKPVEVSVKGALTIVSTAPDGVVKIQEAFKTAPGDYDANYLGGGRYSLEILDSNYKSAEERLKGVIDHVKQIVADGHVSFERTDK